MKHISVVSAQPGYFTVLNLDNLLVKGDTVIAWRIETVGVSETARSYSVPITVHGSDESSNVGVMDPDGKVILRMGETYPSLKAAQASFE